MNSHTVSWLLLLCVGCLGCGGSMPARYEVSGTILYDGMPVPVGTIQFEPLSSNEETGVSGVAVISDGRFVTQKGNGPGAGKYRLRIQGGDGELPPGSQTGSTSDPESPEMGTRVFGTAMFEEIVDEMELPPRNHVMTLSYPKKTGNKSP